MPIFIYILLAGLLLRFLWWLKFAPKDDPDRVPDDPTEAKAWYHGGH